MGLNVVPLFVIAMVPIVAGNFEQSAIDKNIMRIPNFPRDDDYPVSR